jgi:hypothetical protein
MRLVTGVIDSSRCPPRQMPKAANVHARRGLAYQKKVTKAMEEVCKVANGKLEVEPWFRFQDLNGPGQCVPDLLLHVQNITLIIEVKLTFVQDAMTKLAGLYIPVIMDATKKTLGQVRPLIICKNITPLTTNLIDNVHSAVYNYQPSIPVLQWLGKGKIPWV